MPKSWLYVGFTSLLFALLLIAPKAQAEVSDADRDMANELMDQGDALVEEERFSEALSAYQAAHKIMGVPTTGVEVAKTLAKMGKLVEARRLARDVSLLAVKEGEPEPFARARQTADTLAKSLDARVARLTVTLSAPARIVLDGAEMPNFHSGESFDLDPGIHVVVARAVGATSSTSLSLLEGEHRDITLKFASRPVPPVTKPPPPRPRPASVPRAAESHSNTPRTLGWVSLVVGGAGVAFGGVTGAMALSDKSKLDSTGCAGAHCSSAQAEQVDRYNTLRTLSSVGFIGGAVLVGTGALLLGLAPGEPERTGRRSGPRISTGVNGAGFVF